MLNLIFFLVYITYEKQCERTKRRKFCNKKRTPPKTPNGKGAQTQNNTSVQPGEQAQTKLTY